MDGAVGPPANLPEGTRVDVAENYRSKEERIVFQNDAFLESLGLDLHADDLDRNTDDQDHVSADYDNKYQHDSSLGCAKSCSCDSCINISQSISLDFSNGSVTDLADLDNIEQLTRHSIEALRSQHHRSSDSSSGYSVQVTFPRYSKVRSSRRNPNLRNIGGIRRTPRYMRYGHGRSDPRMDSSDQISKASGAANTEDTPKDPPEIATTTPENVALMDHMLPCIRPENELGAVPPPQNTSSPVDSFLNSVRTSENPALRAGPSVESHRAVSFNTFDIHVDHSHRNRSPKISSPRLSAQSPTFPHLSPPRRSSPNASPTAVQSPHNSTKSSCTALRSPRWSRLDANFESSLKTLKFAVDTSPVLSDLRRRSTRSSRSSSAESPTHSYSNSKLSDRLSPRLDSYSMPTKVKSKTTPMESTTTKQIASRQTSQTSSGSARKSSTNMRNRLRQQIYRTSFFSRQGSLNMRGRGNQTSQTSVGIARQGNFNLRTRGKQPTKLREGVQQTVDEDQQAVRRTQKNKHTSEKEPLAHSTFSNRRDVRNFPDSGVGSSASSTFTPSPRGPTFVRRLGSQKRLEKRSTTSIPESDTAVQRASTTSASNDAKCPVPETIPEVEDTKSPTKDTNENRKKSKTILTRSHHYKGSLSLKSPSEYEILHGSSSFVRQSPAKTSSSDFQASTPKRSDASTRNQLEKDFHNLLESLGFVCNPNEPGCSTEFGSSKQQLSPSLHQNPSPYSIPKANFLTANKQRPTTDPTAQPTTPAVLLSDDPADPRRRTDLKAARYYMDNPIVNPSKSVYRSELFSKVDPNKTKQQPIENKTSAATVSESKAPDQNADAGRNSQTNIRRKSKPALKSISLEQIKAIKNTVDNAIADQKIFVIYGAFPSIREALKSRGWIEKRPYPDKKPSSADNDQTAVRNRGSRELFQYGGVGVQTLQSTDPAVLALIESMTNNPNDVDFEEELTERAIVSRMLRNVDPNFIWTIKCDTTEWKRLKKKQIINRYPRAFFATKIGLSTFLRQMHWFSEDGISLTRFPRCYNICQADDMEAFVDDFRLSACLGVLKIIIDRFRKLGEAGVQDEHGKVPKYAMEFAVSRCLDYLVQNSHADLDHSASLHIHCHQWDQFLAWSYELRTEKGRFSKTCPEPSPQVMCDTASSIIGRMAEVWPQLEMDGYLNLWILKPGAKSRGRGIHLINKLDAITEQVSPQHIRDSRYVAQKYIERPLIIFGTKFDIRQWFLVTSVYPMTIWMYRESYLRFCSQSFSLTNMHESIHLCNNAVQAKYKNGKRDPALPDENMWDCYTFQTYLRALGRPELWDSVIYPGMRQGIIGTLLASQEHMDKRTDCFELFGADFMLTEDFNPWLIEINSCPCMAPSTSVTARMCAQCLEDVIKVVIDYQSDKSADTGRFEMVYKQHIPPPPPYLGMNLSVRGRRVNGSNTTIPSSPGHSPKTTNRRIRRPASDPTRRRLRHPRNILPAQGATGRHRLKLKHSDDCVSTTTADAKVVTTLADAASSSESEIDQPTTSESEHRPLRTPTPTCPSSREVTRCSHRPSAIAAIVARQKAKHRVQYNVLAAVGHGVMQPSDDNHRKSIELLREWRQRARTSGLLARSSTTKMNSISSAHSAGMMRRMTSSLSGSGLVAVGVTLNTLMR